MQFRAIDGLSDRYAESDDRSDTALLLNPWPDSLLACEPTWPPARRNRLKRQAPT
jgi:hypothetical protein